jgi:hypothetical protein
MKRKLAALIAIVAIAASGAYAQLIVGVSGALPMDTQMNAADIQAAFQDGSAIMYGGFAELGFGKVGLGLSVNSNLYTDSYFDQLMRTADIQVYFSYHLFGIKAFLDPFGELGAGLIGTMYGDTTQVSTSSFVDASYYWYAAVGVGVNLGPVGIFGKFAYNNAVGQAVSYEDDLGVTQTYPPYGTYLFGDGVTYLPPFRFTLGAKLLL